MGARLRPGAGVAAAAPRREGARYENKPLAHRQPVEVVRRVLHDFNAGALAAATAASLLGGAPLPALRVADGLAPRARRLRAHGQRRRPAQGLAARGSSLPRGVPAAAKSAQLPAHRRRVAAALRPSPRPRLGGGPRQGPLRPSRALTGTPALGLSPLPPRLQRRTLAARWFSIHPCGPAAAKPTLLRTVDDHSGLNLAGRFVESDTTWNHCEHFRQAFETWGLPEINDPDGLSLFGPSSRHDHRDPKSEFQRARRGLGVAHLVAPTPQAKGKIERRFGTFQPPRDPARPCPRPHAAQDRHPHPPSPPPVLDPRASPQGRLAHHFRPFYPLNTCPVLFRQQIRFGTVADRQPKYACPKSPGGRAGKQFECTVHISPRQQMHAAVRPIDPHPLAVLEPAQALLHRHHGRDAHFTGGDSAVR